MSSSPRAEGKLQTCLRQQQVVADLGQRALRDPDADGLGEDACAAVVETLETAAAAVFRYDAASNRLVRRQAVAWTGGQRSVRADDDGAIARAYATGEPVVEEAPSTPGPVPADAGTVLCVPVGPEADPRGVVATYATEQRVVTDAEVTFLRQVAFVVASARAEGTDPDTRTELRRKERRFEAVFEDPNILVGLLDPDGTVRDINETAMEYVDADLAEVTGEPFWETPWWGEGDDVRDDVREWTERAADGEYVEFRVDLTRPDGERYSLEGHFRPVTDDDGDVVSIIVSDRDVTERTERERDLEESEQRYRTLVEHFPNGAVALVDADLRYRTVGGSPLDVAEVTVEDAEGQPVADVLPTELAGELVPHYERAFEGESGEFEAELGGRCYQFRVVPVTDEDGEVLAALGMSQDVTARKKAQRRLERSERRYRTLVENFPNGAVGLFDEELRYQVVGGSGFEDVEVSTEDVVGESLHEWYPPAVVEQLEPKFRAALDGERSTFQFEFHDRTWRTHTLPVTDDEGDIFAGMVMVQDITEQVERERHLRRYESIVETVNDGVYVVEEDGTIAMVNETYAEMLGYDRADLVGADATKVVDAEVIERVRELQTRAQEGDLDRPSLEAEVKTADGSRLPVEATFAPMPDIDTEWERAGVVRDISERKARERELEQSERRYRTLVEHFPNGAVGLFDADLEYSVVGGQLLDELDVDPEDRVGNSIADIYSADLVAEVEPYFRAALNGERNSFEVTLHGRNLHADALPVRNAAGEVFAGMLVVQDVTERREYERKLEASNERLEQFAYAASHDLQEPLRMVSSYLQLVERRYGDRLDEDGREFIAFAVDGAERMREMIDGLLEYSRVDTCGDPLEPVDLNEVLADAREDLQVKIAEHDAEITAAELPRVEGDGNQLRQVFQNLLENAIEYSGDEPPRIRVSAERTGDRWTVAVSDEGIGIAPEDADRIFEVFQSLHSKADAGGTGIGLALCERIVERHGGDIWVDSAPGEGATISFTLPMVRDSDA